MIARAALGLVVLLIAMAVEAPQARAGLRFCNKADVAIDVAIGFIDRQRGWTSQGWWVIDSGQCAYTINGPLDNRYYYYYAKDRKGKTYKGETPFCISMKKFTLYQSEYGDNSEADCAKADLTYEKFTTLDAQGLKEYTVDLDSLGVAPGSPDASAAPAGSVSTQARLGDKGGSSNEESLPPTQAPGLPVKAPAANVTRKQIELVPEKVPFISTQDRQRIRKDYMDAPNYKSLATSLVVMAFVSGQPDQETADKAAMEACAKLNRPTGPTTANLSERICDLYASGTSVVTYRSSPPLPLGPWINPKVERKYNASAVPMINVEGKLAPNGYADWPNSKAIVMSPNGIWYGTYRQDGQQDAMRRSLERCGFTHSASCLVVAVDDSFVVPVPTLAKANGFFRPDALLGVQRDEREAAGRQLIGKNEGWNAVAIGAARHLGLKISALSEREAVDGAVEDCAKRDRDCRVIVIGPFLVEPLNSDAELVERK